MIAYSGYEGKALIHSNCSRQLRGNRPILANDGFGQIFRLPLTNRRHYQMERSAVTEMTLTI
jgi:hypothetical protein